jgi:FHS family glucose/mannose:H+ symporter-like MFS transporter
MKSAYLPKRGPAAPRFSLLSFGFVLCGMVTVLPGPLLPILAAHWGLLDVQSGAFFTALFGASTVGSVFSPRRLRISLPSGYGLMTLGILLLAGAGATVEGPAGHALALAGFAAIGLGIGLSVTATNLTVGGNAGVSAPGERARRLSLVNLWWGVGAVGCPWLLALVERAGHLLWLLAGLAAGTALVFGGLLPLVHGEERRPAEAETGASSEWPVLAFFALFLFLYVGVETVVGGWITTYAHRFSGLTVERASLMVSVYWLALLGGRALGSMALRKVPERAVLLPGLGVGLIAAAIMITPHSGGVVLAAVTAAGAGFGPVFPIGISRMLTRLRDHRKTGVVFAVCASGGAVLPWVTGLVSTRTGSLRLGFAVPVGALVVIAALALTENRLLRGATAK